MCRSAENISPPTTGTAMPSSHHQTNKIVKPRLPRKLAASARINLNRYWHALEELMPASVVGRRPFDEADANAINDNIDNERRLAEMRLAEANNANCFKTDSTNDFLDSPTPPSPPTSGSIEASMIPDENTPPSATPGTSR